MGGFPVPLDPPSSVRWLWNRRRRAAVWRFVPELQPAGAVGGRAGGCGVGDAGGSGAVSAVPHDTSGGRGRGRLVFCSVRPVLGLMEKCDAILGRFGRLLHLLFGFVYLGEIAMCVGEKKKGTIFAVFDSCVPGHGMLVKKIRRLSGSYTVEAAWVMAVVVLTVASIIQFGYRLRGQTTAGLILQEAVEVARHEKQLAIKDVERLFAGTSVTVALDENGGAVEGKAKFGRWELEIEGHKFRPESFLRKVTLLEQLGESDGDSL